MKAEWSGVAFRSGDWMKIDFCALRMQESQASFWGTKTLLLFGGPYGGCETRAIGKGQGVEIGM